MNLNELCEHWKEYVWIFKARYRQWGSKVVKVQQHRARLAEYYYKCEKTFVGRKKIPALKLYRKQTDDGTWGGRIWDVVRCDARGNCYLFLFRASNINHFFWKKCGIFVKTEAFI